MVTVKGKSIICVLIFGVFMIVRGGEIISKVDFFQFAIRVSLNSFWLSIGNKVAHIEVCWLEGLFIGTHVRKSSSENYRHTSGSQTESASSTIDSSVSDTYDNDVAAEFGDFVVLHTFATKNYWSQEIFGMPHVRNIIDFRS